MSTFFILLATFLTGSIMMHLIEKLRTKKSKPKLVCEKFCFQMEGFRFFKKEMTDGSCEFWAYKFRQGRVVDNGNNKYLIGYWRDGEFVSSDELRELPWYLQKSATRFQLMMRGLPHSHSTY